MTLSGHGGAHGFGTGIFRIFVDVAFYLGSAVYFVFKIRESRLSGNLLNKRVLVRFSGLLFLTEK